MTTTSTTHRSGRETEITHLTHINQTTVQGVDVITAIWCERFYDNEPSGNVYLGRAANGHYVLINQATYQNLIGA